ncbi:MAG: hypothetical protein CMP76_08025 [Flavobacterium sp.]|uniref:hypothetical protein n=1 Tax=Flavobacterium sp. TaxID=239 RepID=UPI000C6B792E|nr:hypothetical protein [Flavobacterium sp.]MBF03228.1 hypothetical protein [Flavobacterium sp.]
MKNKGKLSNPAIVATVANSEAGQTVLKNASESQKAIVEQGTKTAFFILKLAIGLGAVYFIYTKIAGRFISFSENKNYPASNITDNQASAKAETIYQAMKGFGNGFDIVKQAIAGVNYNGFVKIYNAFGNREGAIPFSGKMNMIEWFNDQFNESELQQLNFLVPNIFAKTI